MYAAATVWREYCTIRLFFSWLKTQLERRKYKGDNELYELVDEILTGLSIEMIETVFVDWTSSAWLMEMVTTFPKISHVNF
jgi:erythromycin esterase-like protein